MFVINCIKFVPTSYLFVNDSLCAAGVRGSRYAEGGPSVPVLVRGVRGGVLDADLAALAYSGGGSLVSAGISVSLLGVDRAK